jgi:hypothetical protein
VEDAEPADTPSAKYVFIMYAWLLLIFGIPYVILGLVGGFGTTFRSGEASTFICGALVGAVGENIIGRAESRSTRFRGPKSGTRVDSWSVLYVVSALAFLAWNMYFAFQPKTIHYPTIDWVQIVAFAVATAQLISLRFFRSDYYHDFVVPFMKADGDENWLISWLFRE